MPKHFLQPHTVKCEGSVNVYMADFRLAVVEKQCVHRNPRCGWKFPGLDEPACQWHRHPCRRSGIETWTAPTVSLLSPSHWTARTFRCVRIPRSRLRSHHVLEERCRHTCCSHHPKVSCLRLWMLTRRACQSCCSESDWKSIANQIRFAFLWKAGTLKRLGLPFSNAGVLKTSFQKYKKILFIASASWLLPDIVYIYLYLKWPCKQLKKLKTYKFYMHCDGATDSLVTLTAFRCK